MTSLRSRTLWGAAVAAVIVGLLVLADQEPDYSKIQVSTVADLERELGHLRERLDIPGMSAVIAVGHRVVWAHGFGWASLEGRVPVDAYTTIFHLASVTKPYTATVVLQLADEGRLDLNSPVSRFGVDMPEPVHVWHLLSHTSGGTLGTLFRYDARAFGALTTVVEKTSGRPFAAALTDRIIRHLDLKHTGPNPREIDWARCRGQIALRLLRHLRGARQFGWTEPSTSTGRSWQRTGVAGSRAVPELVFNWHGCRASRSGTACSRRRPV